MSLAIVALLVVCLSALVSGFAPMGRFAIRSSIHMVIMPAAPKDVKTGKNIFDSVKGSADHKTLAAALEAAKLGGALSGDDKLALFAPTDAAFAKLPAGTVDALLKDIPKLTQILKYHVSANQQRPTRNGRTYDTLALNEDGSNKELGVLVTVDTPESFMQNANGVGKNGGKVVTTLECTNGYIHVIDGVLLPYAGNKPNWGPGTEKNDAGLASFNKDPSTFDQKA